MQQQSMGNQMYAYMSHASVLLYPRNNEGVFMKIYEDSKMRVNVVDCDSEYSPIYELSVELFKHLLEEQREASTIDKTSKISFVFIHEAHQSWMKDFQSGSLKLQLITSEFAQDNTQFHSFPVNSCFNFKQKASSLDFNRKCDISQRNTLNTLPQQFLLVEMKHQIRISKVQAGEKTLIYRSNLDECFHFSLLRDVLKREEEEQLLHSLDQILYKLVEEGNHEQCDLLVEDIFGTEGCGFIGLPPKLIASSLGKFATGKQGKSTLWDRLKSVILAFAINMAKQINHQVFSTKIKKTIFIPHQFHNPPFLHLLQGIVSHFGEIWFLPHGMACDFIQKLAFSKIK